MSDREIQKPIDFVGTIKDKIKILFETYPICPATTFDHKPMLIRYVGDSFITAVNELVFDEAKKDFPKKRKGLTTISYANEQRDIDIFFIQDILKWLEKWFGDKK